MEGAKQQGIDGFAAISSHGDRSMELHNVTGQPLPPKDGRIISANPSPNVGISGAPRNTKGQPAASHVSGALRATHPFSSRAFQDQGYYIGGYSNSTGNWDEHSNYVNANNLHVIPPGIYNDNTSLFLPPGYGFDAFGQFSPGVPLSPVVIDGQLFSPQQIPVNSPYYHPLPVSPAQPHVASGIPSSQAELAAAGNISQENLIDNAFLGAGSGYYLPFGTFGGDLSGSGGFGVYKFPGEFGSNESMPSHSSSLDAGRFVAPLNSGNAYPQPTGVFGSYEQNVVQTPYQGFGLPSTNSSATNFGRAGSYQSIGSGSSRYRFPAETDRRHERDHNSASISTDTLSSSSDRNRGPRAAKIKSKSSVEEGSSGDSKEAESTGTRTDHINSPDFTTDYKRAKFFVIKSFSEENVHKSIKYGVWASTSLGNKKLDAAYGEAEEIEGSCPVFLFFSVNVSGQFCGVAEMIGPVDFDHDSDHWVQDRWSGQFPVKWHIIKDVPNSCFRHILLENNDSKPVTHSRDSQEVKLDQGIEMLQIFKNHDAETCLLDDFKFYDNLEKSLQERKAKQRASLKVNTNESVNQLAENLAEALHMDSGINVSKTISPE